MKSLPKVSRPFVLILIGLSLAAASGVVLLLHWRPVTARRVAFRVLSWQQKLGLIPGWKEEQEQLRRTWNVIFDPADGVTDVFFASVSGGIPGSPRGPQAVLMWRRDGQAYVARTLKTRQTADKTTVFDLSDGQPIDAGALDNLLSLKFGLDNLHGDGLGSAGQSMITFYIKRGREDGKYLVPVDLLFIHPSPISGFDVIARNFWVPVPIGESSSN